MEFSALQIAGLLNGTIEGNPEVTVNTLSKIEEGVPHSLSFLSNPRYTQYLYTTDASIVIIDRDLILEQAIKPGCTLIRVGDSRKSFARVLEMYNNIKNNKTGIEHPSYISETAVYGENVYIGAFSYIGQNVKIGHNVKIYSNVFIGDNCIIGDNTILYSGAKVYVDCKIGSHCILHSGAIIGGDGFGFAPYSENNYKIPQIGNVILENYVEIGANTTIDRATLGSTILRKGVKLDNLIQVGHNVEIGENTVIAAQTGIAGSTKIGSECMIGGQVGIVGHITIANRVKIAAQSGISNSITKEGEIVQGAPAYKISDYKRSYILFKRLPELQEKIEELEKALNELKQIPAK